jgi:integrase/recombinase XerC
VIGDKPVSAISKADVYAVKDIMMRKGRAAITIATTILALRRLLLYARDELKLAVLEPKEVTPPRRPRREVLYLTPEDVARFVAAIRTETHRGESMIVGVRFRALVEALLGSGLRIGELLSLNRDSIDYVNGQAKVIGKGNQERVAFFTARSLGHIKEYLSYRRDECPALFATTDGKRRWKRDDLWRYFARYGKLSGLTKPVRPHILRHTAATTLLFNGCSIGHIRELLGHARLETTFRYYLGVDKRGAKEALRRCLRY